MTLIAPARKALYTIGHSSHGIEAFVRLVDEHSITTVVDVRSQPYSQYSPQFNHEPLETALEANGIEYVFAGDTLGGRPKSLEFYDHDGRVKYYKVAASDTFEEGIARLEFLLDNRERVAILCSEEDPTNCHRRLLVGRVMAAHGVAVNHLRGDGRIRAEGALAPATKVSSLVQQGLFDQGEESSWKSTRSVLPARPRSSSSSH